jgi:pimeloyl-ACP methyl ester carboxylesterase
VTTMTSIYKTPAGRETVLAMYDGALAYWPVPHAEITVPTRFGDTFVIASGDQSAPPLVLLHGAASNALAWMGDIGAYSQNFRVYAVDMPGEPGHSTTTRPSYANQDYAAWMTDLLDGLDAPAAILIGISQGGWTALRFATCYPARVAKLVLLAPGGVAPAKLSFILRAIPLAFSGRWGAEQINRITFGGAPIAPEAVSFMNVIMTNFKPRFDPAPLFTDEALRRLQMPVMAVVGAKDTIFPSAKTAARLQACVPGLELHVLPEEGHVLHNTAQLVLPFLQGR